jgi:Zn-dependent peptidase ImmA (M78 family)/transcriptional regulator with XRE-family HTH domain
MTRQDVPINGAVLQWAREEAGLSTNALAEQLKVDVGTLASWERNEAMPSKGQFTKLVERLRRPSAVFFLPVPPQTAALPTSFRRAPGLNGHDLVADELKNIRRARRLQEIVEWVQRDAGQPPIEFPRANPSDSPATSGSAFREFLGLTIEEQLGWKTANEAGREWRRRLEGVGVIVLQMSMGKASIRGFSAWSDRAPVVALNTAYHPTARIFTLLHEAAHLATRTDSACFDFVAPASQDNRLERWCEQFAASALLPGADVRRFVVAAVGEGHPVTDVDVVRSLANRFKSSSRAMSLRLQELGLAPSTLYASVAQALSAHDWNDAGGGGGGQPRVEKRLGELGPRAVDILIAASERGRLHQRDLADHLRLTSGQVDDLRSMLRSA